MTSPADPYDSSWKEAIDALLPHMMQLLYPEAYEELDWSQPYVSLNSELRSLSAEGAPDDRRADALYRILRKCGREFWLIVHIEVQSTPDGGLPKRMFEYAYRCFEKYGVEVAGYAVLGDLVKAYRPNSYGWSIGKGSMLYTYEVAKLIDFRPRMAELEQSENPFALVVLAHLHTKATRNDQVRRRQAKLRLIRLLLERGYEDNTIRQLFGVLDRMLQLNREQAIIFKREVEDLQERKAMAYLTIWEEEAQAKGIQQGLQQGVQQGIERVLGALLASRFGALPEWAAARLHSASAEVLERWSVRVLDASSLEDVFA